MEIRKEGTTKLVSLKLFADKNAAERIVFQTAGDRILTAYDIKTKPGISGGHNTLCPVDISIGIPDHISEKEK